MNGDCPNSSNLTRHKLWSCGEETAHRNLDSQAEDIFWESRLVVLRHEGPGIDFPYKWRFPGHIMASLSRRRLETA